MRFTKCFFIAVFLASTAGCGNEEAEKFNGTWSGEDSDGYDVSYIIQHKDGDRFIVEINTGMFKGSSFYADMEGENTLQHERKPSAQFNYNEQDGTLYWTGKETVLNKEEE